MPQNLVSTVWDYRLPEGAGVQTAWDTPGAAGVPASPSPSGIPVGGVTGTNLNTGVTGGYGYGYDPFGGGGAAANLADYSAKANLAAAPDLEKISQLINALNEAQQQTLNKSRLGPQGEAVQNQLLTNAADYAAGRIPESEINQLAALMAERGAGGGFGVDNPNTSAALARAFNIRQGDLQAQGEKQYLDLLAANPSAPLFDISSQLVSPALYESTASAQAQRQIQQQALAQTAQQNALQRQIDLEVAAINAQAKKPTIQVVASPAKTATTQPAYPTPAVTPLATALQGTGAYDYTNYPGQQYDPWASPTVDPYSYGSQYADLPGANYDPYAFDWTQYVDPFSLDFYEG